MPAKKCWFCNKNNDPNASFCVKCGTPFDWIDKEPGERVRILFKTANKGYSLAQYNLGVYYEAGVGVPQNYEEAARWYLKSAKQGDADAQASLGQCYQFGKGVPLDYDKALLWCWKAVEQGNAKAQNNLAVMYEYGQGVPLDYEEAAKWYRKAAEQGVAVAQKNLGQLYDSGQGVPKDYTEAVKWYLKAAKQGNAIAQTNLGYAYHRGEGITQDYEEAVKWYRKAIEQGQSAAQNNLGVMYRDGQGVSQDFEEAARLFQKSAEQGDETAKKNLAALKKRMSEKKSDGEKPVREKPVDDKPVREKPVDDKPIREEPADDKSPEQEPGTDTETLQDLLEQLNSMIGLQSVKKEVQNRINRIRISRKAEELGSKRVFSSGTLHMVFTGNPGTGKTTVARLLGKIYGRLGILKNPDVFVECGRDDLVIGYIGQTAARVKEKFAEAKGGILFIDEAYSLYNKDEPKDFGHEAINAMVQYMESMRDEIIVIVAGYSKEMGIFIREANPGLASRFPVWLDFEDYSVPEMMRIFYGMIGEKGYYYDGDGRVLQKLLEEKSKEPGFGNARGVRNLTEKVIAAQGVRLSSIGYEHIFDKEMYLKIEDVDLKVVIKR